MRIFSMLFGIYIFLHTHIIHYLNYNEYRILFQILQDLLFQSTQKGKEYNFPYAILLHYSKL